MEEPQLKLRAMLRRNGVARSLLPFAICAILGGWATGKTVEIYLARREMPASAKIALKQIEANSQQIVITTRLEDTDYLFRWLDPAGLVVRVQPQPQSGLSGQEVKSEVVKPERVMPYSDNGTLLPEGDFSPHYGPLVLAVHLPYSAKPGESGEVELFYSPIGLGEFLVGETSKPDAADKEDEDKLVIPSTLKPILKASYQRAS